MKVLAFSDSILVPVTYEHNQRAGQMCKTVIIWLSWFVQVVSFYHSRLGSYFYLFLTMLHHSVMLPKLPLHNFWKVHFDTFCAIITLVRKSTFNGVDFWNKVNSYKKVSNSKKVEVLWLRQKQQHLKWLWDSSAFSLLNH